MLLSIGEWWDGLTTMQAIYWSVSIPATLVLIILLIGTFIGGDVDGDISDVDAEISGDAGIGFQFFSLKNVVGFLAIFGWSGLACVDAGLAPVVCLLISTICGFIMMAIMATLFFLLMKMQDSGTLSLKNAIGKVGEIYLRIPANRGGFGKVQITVQGSVRELDAMTDDDEELTSGMIVSVLDVIDQHILLVTKSNK